MGHGTMQFLFRHHYEDRFGVLRLRGAGTRGGPRLVLSVTILGQTYRAIGESARMSRDTILTSACPDCGCEQQTSYPDGFDSAKATERQGIFAMKIHCPSCGRVQKPHNTRAIFLSSIGKMVYMAQSEQLLNGSLHLAPVPPISIDKREV
jgi:hypothetical protein